MGDKFRATNGRRVFDDDEVDDFTFLRHPKQGASGYILRESQSEIDERENDEGRRQKQIMEEIERVNRRALESSKRSLGMVHESEQMGIETAQELLHQREQLESCETKVGDINRSLRTSQKHINSIKSIFGGLVNRFSKSSEATSVSKPSSDAERPSRLASTVENAKATAPQYISEHPALRLREVDYSEGASSNPFDEPSPTARAEDQLNQNLDDLGLGLSRLKGLAIGLGDEIEEQNEVLDRLNAPIDKAELAIQRQNKEMRKILHK